jgi:hypothetical protein
MRYYALKANTLGTRWDIAEIADNETIERFVAHAYRPYYETSQAFDTYVEATDYARTHSEGHIVIVGPFTVNISDAQALGDAQENETYHRNHEAEGYTCFQMGCVAEQDPQR